MTWSNETPVYMWRRVTSPHFVNDTRTSFLLLIQSNSVSNGTNGQDIGLKQKQYSYNVSMDLFPDT